MGTAYGRTNVSWPAHIEYHFTEISMAMKMLELRRLEDCPVPLRRSSRLASIGDRMVAAMPFIFLCWSKTCLELFCSIKSER